MPAISTFSIITSTSDIPQVPEEQSWPESLAWNLRAINN